MKQLPKACPRCSGCHVMLFEDGESSVQLNGLEYYSIDCDGFTALCFDCYHYCMICPICPCEFMLFLGYNCCDEEGCDDDEPATEHFDKDARVKFHDKRQWKQQYIERSFQPLQWHLIGPNGGNFHYWECLRCGERCTLSDK